MAPIALLLRAATCDAREAPAAWREWARRQAGAPPGTDARRLLPLAYANLIAHGVTEAELGPLPRAAYRSTRLRNRQRFAQLSHVLDVLATHDIDPIVLKGAGLVAGCYRDAGVRPMGDVDVLVPQERARAAAGALERDGWRPDHPVDGDALVLRHSVLFRRGDSQCDLHWGLFAESSDGGLIERCGDRSTRAVLDGRAVRILCPADQLLQVVVQGVRAFETTAVRWIPDALALLRSAEPPVAWDVLLDEVRRQRLAYPVGVGCGHLVHEFGAPVPSWFMAAVASRRGSMLERWIYRADATRWHAHPIAVGAYVLHLGRCRSKGLLAAIAWTLRYLRCAWQLPGTGAVLGQAARRAFRRLPSPEQT